MQRFSTLVVRCSSSSARSLHSSARVFKDALIPVPRMGDSITEGTLIKFTVEPGMAVKLDDIICVIETDKVCVPTLSFFSISLSFCRPHSHPHLPPPSPLILGFC